MSIKGIETQFAPIRSIIEPPQQTQPGSALGPGKSGPVQSGGSGFGEMFNDALKEVDQLQKTANTQIEQMVMGGSEVSPHGAMIALEKADMAFQLMNTIRSKIIRAYEEVIRTQV